MIYLLFLFAYCSLSGCSLENGYVGGSFKQNAYSVCGLIAIHDEDAMKTFGSLSDVIKNKLRTFTQEIRGSSKKIRNNQLVRDDEVVYSVSYYVQHSDIHTFLSKAQTKKSPQISVPILCDYLPYSLLYEIENNGDSKLKKTIDFNCKGLYYTFSLSCESNVRFLQNKIASQEEDLKNFQDWGKQKEEEVTSSYSLATQLRLEKDGLRKELAKSEEQVVSLNTSISALQSKNGILQAQLEESQKEVLSLNASIKTRFFNLLNIINQLSVKVKCASLLFCIAVVYIVHIRN